MTNGIFFEDLSAGQTVTATVEVIRLNPDKKRANPWTIRGMGDELVIEGEAHAQVLSRA
jgi:hypothetical protein